MARVRYVYKNKYTLWIVLTSIALGLFLWYFFKNSGGAQKQGEKCPDGRPIPENGDCGTREPIKDSTGAIKVPIITPDANGCITVSKYITNSFPLTLAMKGELVRALQKNLNTYFNAGIKEDGYFGCKTLDAVIKNLKINEVDINLYNNSSLWVVPAPTVTLSPNTTQRGY